MLLLFIASLLQAGAGVGVKAAQARREAQKEWPTKTDFLRRLANITLSTNPGARAFIFDIGSNDGAWTREMLRLSSVHQHAPRVVPILVEPQPAARLMMNKLLRSIFIKT